MSDRTPVCPECRRVTSIAAETERRAQRRVAAAERALAVVLADLTRITATARTAPKHETHARLVGAIDRAETAERNAR